MKTTPKAFADTPPKAFADTPPNLFTRLDGRGDTRTYKKNPKTYVKSPRYDPVRHRFNANKEPFVNKVKEIKKFGIGYPDQLGETNNIASVFTTQVEKRLNEKIVPDAARGLSVYTHKRHDGVNFFVKGHQAHGIPLREQKMRQGRAQSGCVL